VKQRRSFEYIIPPESFWRWREGRLRRMKRVFVSKFVRSKCFIHDPEMPANTGRSSGTAGKKIESGIFFFTIWGMLNLLSQMISRISLYFCDSLTTVRVPAMARQLLSEHNCGGFFHVCNKRSKT
jgi:hypothetical protein